MITMTPRETVGMVLAAGGYIDVFGMPPTGAATAGFLNERFRLLRREVHPDRHADADKQSATDAFTRLSTLHEDALRAVRMGRYGEAAHLAVMRSRIGSHSVIRSMGPGDLSTGYLAESTIGGATFPTFCKVVTNARDNDLMKTEAQALKILWGPDTEEKWRPYTTQLIDTFLFTEPGKPRRRANVLTIIEGDKGHYTFEELRKLFPKGVHPLHAAWMWRRLLCALGFAHDNGIIHGAVLPRNVMVLPSEHGIVLGDWCYASIRNDDRYPALRALVDDHRDWYPTEVLSREEPSPATDLYLAAMSMIYLLGGDPVKKTMPSGVPLQMQAFLRGCLQTKQSMRPQDAWLLLRDFDELLRHLGGEFYPRKFREFVVPNGSTIH